MIEKSAQRPGNKQTVAYFFCDDKEESQKSAQSLLRTIIHQLVKSNPRLIVHAMQLYITNGSRLFTSLADLWDIFIAISRDPLVSGTYVILDGIDECEESSRNYVLDTLCNHFRQLIGSSSIAIPYLKVLVTSRPYNDIERKLKEESIIRLKAEEEEEKVNVDIRSFVCYELDELEGDCCYSLELKEEIRNRLVRGADGSFLWAS
jgi:hypothetical protein